MAGLDLSAAAGKKGHGPVQVDTTVADVLCRRLRRPGDPGWFRTRQAAEIERGARFVRRFDTACKLIALDLSRAGWAPISAQILEGRRATSVGAIRDDMVNAGVEWVDEATVVDGNLISARTPADLGPWMKALLAALEESSG